MIVEQTKVCKVHSRFAPCGYCLGKHGDKYRNHMDKWSDKEEDVESLRKYFEMRSKYL